MDTGKGNFEMLDREKLDRILETSPNLGELIFTVGEVVQVKGSFFKIVKVTPKKLTLRLLPHKV